MAGSGAVVDWRGRAAVLAGGLVDGEYLTDPALIEAFRVTPRHVFVPAFYAVAAGDGERWLVDSADPGQYGEWLDGVYADEALLTQHRPAKSGFQTGVPTSSSTAPSAMAVMLERLDLRDGNRVLEIGTGSGYNAALLCHRLGEENVTTVELDPALADEAANRLARLGYHPRVVAGDGALGAADSAPFDAIIATCSLGHIPPPWINQLVTGGRIVTPFGARSGSVAVLTKNEPESVTGRFDSFEVYFMPLRPHLDDPAGPLDPDHVAAMGAVGPFEGVTEVDPAAVLADRRFIAWVELYVSPIEIAEIESTDAQPGELLLIANDSQARVEFARRPDGTYRIRQYGSRRP